MSDVRLGFIGAGFIAQFLAEAMKQVRGCELTAIYKRSGAETLAAFVRENRLGDPVLCLTIADMVEHCDALVILSPNYTRIQVMQEIADACSSVNSQVSAVMCEKPLGRNLTEARKMQSLAESAGLKTAYLENQLHMAAINQAIMQLQPQQNSHGHFTLARSTEEHGGPHNAWFWDPVLQGGGVLSDMGCHSIAVCQHILTPPGKALDFLEPVAIQCDVALLKWGQSPYREKLQKKYGVDYSKTPAEDFATGIVTFRNPDTDQLVKGQFTDSWMYDKQGLRLSMDALGPGYAFEVNTLISPLEIFIGDEAADGVADAETALEKATASRGLLAVQPNEPHLYGYVNELQDAVDAFAQGKDAMLDWQYGVQISFLVQAAYMAAEQGKTLDLTDSSVRQALETYESLIASGKGAEVLS